MAKAKDYVVTITLMTLIEARSEEEAEKLAKERIYEAPYDYELDVMVKKYG